MNPYQFILDALVRIGYALVAGVLIAMIPFSLNRAVQSLQPRKRWKWAAVMLVFMILFGLYVTYLWQHMVPVAPSPPPFIAPL